MWRLLASWLEWEWLSPEQQKTARLERKILESLTPVRNAWRKYL